MSDGCAELTEEQAFYVTGTSSREALERELDRLHDADVIYRWMGPDGDPNNTYLIIWAPYELEPGWRG